MVRKLGTSVNAGFAYVRARKGATLAAFFRDVVRRGLGEFYVRWANNIDAFGWAYVIAESGAVLEPRTSQLANETTQITISRRSWPSSLTIGFLPYDRYPRIGSWLELRPTAFISHLMSDGALGKRYEEPPGVKPFKGHRQRLDRYDETDFDSYTAVMEPLGLWLPEGWETFAWDAPTP